jgi:hypothetical protein
MKMFTKLTWLMMVFVLISAIVAGQTQPDNRKSSDQNTGLNLSMSTPGTTELTAVHAMGEKGDSFDPYFNPYSSQIQQQSIGGTDDTKMWVIPSTGATSGNSRAPSNFWKYQRTKYLITPAEMAASGFPNSTIVNSIGFFINSAGTGTLTGTLKVWLLNTTDVTYTQGLTWDVIGYTMVSNNASFSVPISPAGLVYDEVFTGGSPFTYTGGGVYVAWEFESPAGTIGTVAVVHNCNVSLTNGLAGYRGTAQGTGLAYSNWRPATRFGTTAYNDIVEVTNIYTLEKVPTPNGTPTPVGIRVSNVSGSPVTFNLTLEVREATFSVLRYTATQAVTALAAYSSTTVNFTGWNPTLLENVNVKGFTSAIVGETWTLNNTRTIPANVNNDRYSYCYSNIPGSGYGYTYPSEGIFSAKYKMNGTGTIQGVDIFIYNHATVPGKTIFACVLNSAGTIVAQTSNYVIQTGDLGAYKNFPLATPVTFTNEDFYVGLGVTYLTGTATYYPLGIIAEDPPRGNTFYNFAITGGTPTALTGGWKYMIEAVLGAGITDDVATLSIDLGEVVTLGTFNPKAIVINNGTNTQTFNVNMTINPGGYTSTKTVTSLLPGGTFQVTFDPWTNALGNYTVNVCTQLPGDLDPSNDCKSQAVKVLDLNKIVYGYNAFPGTGTDPEGPMTFNLSNPGNLTSLADQSALSFIAGSTWANGVWYGSVYNTVTPYDFITIDPVTGARTVIGDLGVNLNGMSFNPANGIMYGVGFDNVSNSKLYTVNMATGAATLVGDCGANLLINLAINSAGNGYAVDINTDVLGSVNLATGAFTPIGSIGFNAQYAQDMEFDRDNGNLFMAAYGSSGQLRYVDVATGNTYLIGDFEGGGEVTGFAIPYISGYDVSGTLTYNGDPLKPMDNVIINLMQGASLVDTDVTGINGTFLFTNIPNGVYNYSASTIKPAGQSNGATTVGDISLVIDHVLGTPLIGIQFTAADVDISLGVDVGDIGLMIDNILGTVIPWAAADWLFENPVINVSGADVIVNFKSLCSGDPDGDYPPPPGK